MIHVIVLWTVWKFVLGVSNKRESTNGRRFYKCFVMLTVFNNKISVMQDVVIRNGQKCVKFGYNPFKFGPVLYNHATTATFCRTLRVVYCLLDLCRKAE